MKICNNHYHSKEELGGLGHIPTKFYILGQRKTQGLLTKKKKKQTQNLRQEDIGIIEAGAQILKLDNITYNTVIILIT